MAQVQGSLAPIWELQPEFWAPDFKPSPVVALTGLWESKPVELPVSVCLSVSISPTFKTPKHILKNNLHV